VKAPSLRFRAAYAARPSPFRIEAAEAHAMTERGALMIDVRRGDDPAETLPGATRVSPDELPGRVPGFPRDVPIVLACT
jgi:rhodanese-related sulfurtransferase